MAEAVSPSWSYSCSGKIQIRGSNNSFFELRDKNGLAVASAPDAASLLRYAFRNRMATAGELADIASKFGVSLSDVLIK